MCGGVDDGFRDGICPNIPVVPVPPKASEKKDDGLSDGVNFNSPEPMSIPNNNPAIWDLVAIDMKGRDSIGQKKYNTRLQAYNGRDALKDAYQEALDLAVYLRQALYERDGF